MEIALIASLVFYSNASYDDNSLNDDDSDSSLGKQLGLHNLHMTSNDTGDDLPDFKSQVNNSRPSTRSNGKPYSAPIPLSSRDYNSSSVEDDERDSSLGNQLRHCQQTNNMKIPHNTTVFHSNLRCDSLNNDVAVTVEDDAMLGRREIGQSSDDEGIENEEDVPVLEATVGKPIRFIDAVPMEPVPVVIWYNRPHTYLFSLLLAMVAIGAIVGGLCGDGSCRKRITIPFQTKDELDSAVKQYFDGNAEAVTKRYGRIEDWDVSRITNFDSLFASRIFYSKDDLHKWDVSQATSMNYMFQGAINFNSNISHWDVSKVTDFTDFLAEAEAFDGDLSSWDVSNVACIDRMFYGASSFTGAGLEHWNVSNVQTMNNTFSGAESFNANLSLWDVSNVTNMIAMFEFATSFKGTGVEHWDVSKVYTMYDTFADAHSVNADLSQWDVSNVTDMTYLFWTAKSFTGAGLENWNTSNVIAMESMFEHAVMFDADLS
jgi:surface protein